MTNDEFPPSDGWTFLRFFTIDKSAICDFCKNENLYYIGPPKKPRCLSIQGMLINPMSRGYINIDTFYPIQNHFESGRQVFIFLKKTTFCKHSF